MWYRFVLKKTTARKGLLCALMLMSFSSLRAEEQDEDFVEARPGEQIGNEDSDIDPGIGITEVVYSGSGCPQDSAQAVITDDKKTLSLLFSAFDLEIVPGTGQQAKKDCRVEIELRTPNNIRATIVRVDYRGFNKLPQRSQSVLSQRYTILDLKNSVQSSMITRRKIFQGPLEKDFMVSSPIRRLQQWSKCGEDFRINLDVGLSLSNPGRKDTALAVLDSMDGTAGKRKAQYALRWKRCSDGPRGIKPPPRLRFPGRPHRPEPPRRPDRPGGRR
jgi:hypothetical protein